MCNVYYTRFPTLTRVYSAEYFVAESVLPSMCYDRSEHSLTHHKITLAKTPELHWVTLAQTCSYHRHRRHLAAQITRLFGTDMTVLCFCKDLCDAKNEQAKYWRHIRCINAVKSYKTSRSGATVSAILARLTTVTLAGWCTVSKIWHRPVDRQLGTSPSGQWAEVFRTDWSCPIRSSPLTGQQQGWF